MKQQMKKAIAGLGVAAMLSFVPVLGQAEDLSYDEVITRAESLIASLEAEPALASRLPDEYRKGLNIGMTFRFPPLRWLYKEQQLGPEYDLARALGKLLGTDVTIVDVAFDSIIPSIKARRIDLSVASMADLPDRREQVTFVNYYSSGTAIEVVKGNPHNVQDLAGLCGFKVAIQQGVSGVKHSQDQSEKCVAEGNKPIDIQLYESANDATLAVVSGRADATINDYPAALYESKTIKDGEALEVVNALVTTGSLYGIVIRKEETEFQKLIQDTLQTLMDKGVYQQIYTNHGLAQGLIPVATINAGHN